MWTPTPTPIVVHKLFWTCPGELKRQTQILQFLQLLLEMKLTKCVPSLQIKCIEIPVKGISFDITVPLISSLTPMSFFAKLVFLLLLKRL